MPLFDFHCTACGKDFESLMKPYDPVECKHCLSKLVNKKPCVAATHIWKPGTEIPNPKKNWAGKPDGSRGR